jgi:hypothetical protein
VGLAWLGGQPESALLVCLTGAAWTLYRVLALRRGRREAVRAVALAGGALVLGLALAGAMLVPLWEALQASPGTDRSNPPMPLKVLAALVVPEYWGRPDRADAAGPVNFTERTVYLGALPLLLACAGLVARRPAGPQVFFAALAAVCFTLALDTGPVAELGQRVPLLEDVALNRAVAVASFALAMLAAFGLQRWLDGDAAVRRPMLLAAGALAALPALAAFAAHPGWLGELPDGARRMLGRGPDDADTIALAAVLRWVVAAGAAVALLAFVRGRARIGAVACLVVGVDLLILGFGYNPAIDAAQADPPEPAPVGVLRSLSASGGRVAGIGALEPNTASRWGLRDALGHEQPEVERVQRVLTALGGSATVSTAAFDPTDERTPRLLDLFAVRGLLLPAGSAPPPAGGPSEPELIPEPGPAALAADGIVLHDGPDGVVVERPSALPRAFVAYGWRRSRGLDESVAGMTSATAEELRDRPVIETAADPPPATPPPATPARITHDGDTEVTVAVGARAPGRLVLLDAHYPGWKATVDGRDAAIEPADGAFRSVAVPAGAHTVRFAYRPASVWIGIALSLAALAVVLAGIALGARQPPGGTSARAASSRDA